MKLSENLIYQSKCKSTKDLMRKAVQLGRVARRAGKKITHMPRYVDPDMKMSWQYGWRWENKTIIARQQKNAPKDPIWVGKGRLAWESGRNIRQWPRYATPEQKEAWQHGWRERKKKSGDVGWPVAATAVE